MIVVYFPFLCVSSSILAGSQIDLGSHVIADLASLPSHQSPSSHLNHIHHSVAKGPTSHGALPATLNCCHDTQSGSAESEDWNWYKRHSVSVMDYRRISALREKSASDNRDHLVAAMGIYDIPPNHDKRLESGLSASAIHHGYDHPRSFFPVSKTSPGNVSTTSGLDQHNYCNSSVLQNGKKSGGCHLNLLNNKDFVLKEDPKESSLCHPNNEDESHSASMSRTETLQKLSKQEHDIQKEMKLLDEMLLTCTAHNEDMPVPSTGAFVADKNDSHLLITSPKRVSYQAAYANYDEVPMRLKESAKDEYINTRFPLKNYVKDPDIDTFKMPSDKDFEIISGNISSSPKKTDNAFYLKNANTPKKSAKSTSQLNKTMPEETPLSPLFHAKLNSIPSKSKLNAPLPYVNLSRYDDEASSHVHLPGRDDCLPVARGSSFSNLNTSREGHNRGPVVWRQHSGSMSSLHHRVASSMTNLNQYSDFLHHKNQSRAQFQRKQAFEGLSHSAVSETDPEILVVNLEGKRELSSTQKLKDSSSRTAVTSEDKSRIGIEDNGLVNLLTADRVHEDTDPSMTQVANEGIYENLPVLREDTPPPALPPRGPANLRKAKSSTTTPYTNESSVKCISMSPPLYPRHNKSFTSFHNSSFGYDNAKMSAKINPNHSFTKTDNNGGGDGNYFHMGSPTTSHKFSSTVPMMVPSKKKQVAKVPAVRDDYMEMGVMALDTMNRIPDGSSQEDEIYLDLEETLRLPPTHQMERKLSGKSGDRALDFPLASTDLGEGAVAGGGNRESTYVEMTNVNLSPRKSMVIQNLETLQAYVSQKSGEEKNDPFVEMTVMSSHPPVPRPYKVRHNSDSGLPTKQNRDVGSADPEKPRTKSPMKIYTKVKSTDTVNKNVSDPPLPFQNLMDFTRKMPEGRPTYVNTFIDAEKNLEKLDNDPRSVQLPEPIKEGFLARLKRRSSRDKGTPVLEREKSSYNSVNSSSSSKSSRSSILERSMSEHDSSRSNKDEKTFKLKIGRRRSSSFPNRLSYQEGQHDEESKSNEKKTESPFNSSSSCSSKFNFISHNSVEQSESSSSVPDFSDESDVSPLLKRVGKKLKPFNAVTVMHAQQAMPSDKDLFLQTSRSTSCMVSSMPNSSSKTDDEKLSEMLFKGPSCYSQSPQGFFDKAVSLNRSFNLEKKDLSSLNNFNNDKLTKFTYHQPSLLYENRSMRSSESFSAEYTQMDAPSLEKLSLSMSLDNEIDTLHPPKTQAPALPPKNRNYHNLLSSVPEGTPPVVPPRPVIRDRGQSTDNGVAGNRDEDSVMDQYVELSSSYTTATAPAPCDAESQVDDQKTSTSLDSKAGTFVFSAW